ncbi:MAG: hypothetical protein ACREK2_05320 [Gemmatimonadota bacterium]
MGTGPIRPDHLDPLALEFLDLLRNTPAAGEIVLGGYFALRHYMDYRATHDLDAWWRTGRVEEALQAVRRVAAAVAERHGMVLGERQWGETVSFDLAREEKTVFSFQIAVRSIELDPATVSSWPPVLIESLHDNIGAKMNALVERGAARDFLDIKEAVTRGLVSASTCWQLWSRKNPGRDPRAAMAHVLKHLEALEQRRPLAEIRDTVARDSARRARAWIRRTLLEQPDVPEE